MIEQSNRKPNKIWVDRGGEFYNHVFKKWLSDNDIIMYSTYSKGKSVVAERFIKHNTIKMKPKDVKDGNKRVYIDEHNEKVLNLV